MRRGALRQIAGQDAAIVAGADEGGGRAGSVEGDERLAEMARLLSGLSDSESALAHAAELLVLGAAPNHG